MRLWRDEFEFLDLFLHFLEVIFIREIIKVEIMLLDLGVRGREILTEVAFILVETEAVWVFLVVVAGGVGSFGVFEIVVEIFGFLDIGAVLERIGRFIEVVIESGLGGPVFVEDGFEGYSLRLHDLVLEDLLLFFKFLGWLVESFVEG